MTNPANTETGTDLRDHRLHRALAHAPDNAVLPASKTRKNIKIIANYSMSTSEKAQFSSPMPWWTALGQKLWKASGHGRTGRSSSPWNAAFATLLLGGIITLIWQGHDVPEARLEKRSAEKRVPETPLPPPAMTAPTPLVLPAPSTSPAPSATASPVAKPAPLALPEAIIPPEAPRGDSPPTDKAEKASQPAAPANAKANLDRSAAPAVLQGGPMLEQQESPAGRARIADKSASATPVAPQPSQTQGERAAPPTTASAMPPSAPAPARVAAPAPASAPGPAPATAFGNVTGNAPSAVQPGPWTAADVQYQSRTTRLAQRDAQNLVDQVLAVAAASTSRGGSLGETSPPVADGTPLLQLQLFDQNSPVAVARFDLWGGGFSWQRPDQPDVVGVLAPQAVAALLAQAVRVLPR